MSYLKKGAFLRLRKTETFDISIKIPDESGELVEHKVKARELSAKEQAMYYASAEENKNPLLQLIMLALLCLCDPDDPNKRLFNAESEEDLRAVGEMDINVLSEISRQYNEHVSPPKSEKEITAQAKNSEPTGIAEPSGEPVGNSESLTPISSSSDSQLVNSRS